jgi:hypothetical protein
MESNKQERKNLVDDNPVQKEASALKNVNKGYGQEVKSPMAMMKSKKPSTAFAMKMSETKSALPMSMPDSPMKKALVGNQNRLPQGLQDDIKAAPESPAKMYNSDDSGNSNMDYTSPVKAKPGLGKDFSYKTTSTFGIEDVNSKATNKKITDLASNKGTSKKEPKATIKSIRKDTRTKKRNARQATRDGNKDRRRALRETNRNEKDPTKRMANKVQAQKDNETDRKKMRAKKRDIRQKARG